MIDPLFFWGLYGVIRMGLPNLYRLSLAVVLVSPLGFASAATYDLGPSDYKNFGSNPSHSPAGIRSSFGQTVRIPSPSTALAVTRTAVVPYGSLATGLRTLTSLNPVGIAVNVGIAGLFAAVDWSFDDSGQLVKPGGDSPIAGLWTARAGGVNYSSATPAGACSAAIAPMADRGITFSHIDPIEQSGSTYSAPCIAYYRDTQGYGVATVAVSQGNCPSGTTFNPVTGTCLGFVPGPSTEPVTDADWDSLSSQLPNLPADVVANAAGDVQRINGSALPGYTDQTITGPASTTSPPVTTTSIDAATGSTTTTQTTSTTEYTYGDTSVTTNTTTTTATYTDGNFSGSTTTNTGTGTSTQPSDSPFELPSFCSWALVVCDWLKWTQELPPEEPDLSSIISDTGDLEREKDISFGIKSCPADIPLNIGIINQTVMLSFNWFCELAGILYFMVMASSYVYAAYITLGVSRG